MRDAAGGGILSGKTIFQTLCIRPEAAILASHYLESQAVAFNAVHGSRGAVFGWVYLVLEVDA